MTTFILHGEHITLAQAAKAVGIADSGGRAKHLIREGEITVNGAVENHPGRKLFPGDRFGAGEDQEWLVSKES